MLDARERFLVLSGELTEPQRHFLMLRGHGLTIRECAEELGLAVDTVTNWPYHATNAEVFREARDLLKANPQLGEELLHRAIRFRTLNRIYTELISPKARADVIRLGAEVEGLVLPQPIAPPPTIVVTMQALLPQFAQDIAEQYQRLITLDATADEVQSGLPE